MSEDVSKIAASLTKAQRTAITNARESGWHGMNHSTCWQCVDAGRVRNALVGAGLAYLAVPRFAWKSSRREVVLTPLGEAVRAHLLETVK